MPKKGEIVRCQVYASGNSEEGARFLIGVNAAVRRVVVGDMG